MKTSVLGSVSEIVAGRLGDTTLLAEWCRRWRVSTLSVFGSVLDDRFSPDSDIDFLAQFENGSRPGLFDLLRAEEELARIVDRPVDLLDWDAMMADENYIHREHLRTAARVVYDA
jgi:predicted nucleotidyltransferase